MRKPILPKPAVYHPSHFPRRGGVLFSPEFMAAKWGHSLIAALFSEVHMSKADERYAGCVYILGVGPYFDPLPMGTGYPMYAVRFSTTLIRETNNQGTASRVQILDVKPIKDQ